MTEQKFRKRLGAFILVLSVGLLALLALCFLWRAFEVGELTTIVAIVIPMFTCYATPAFRHFVDNRYAQDDYSKQVVNSFVVMAFGGTFAFSFAIFGIIFLRAWGGYFPSFEQFEHTLLAINAPFAVYIGYIIEEVFARKTATTRRRH
jgi:hypothetical protein